MSLTNTEKRQLRSDLFLYIDGIALVPAISFLYKHDILSKIDLEDGIEVEALSQQISANSGYLAVLLRMLASQGYVEYKAGEDNARYISRNKATQELRLIAKKFSRFDNLLDISININEYLFKSKSASYGIIFDTILSNYKELMEMDISSPNNYRAAKNIEGYILAPIMVAMTMNGPWDRDIKRFNPDTFSGNIHLFQKIIAFLEIVGFISKDDTEYSFTDTGLFYVKRASAFGVTVSYLQTFSMINELVFGDPKKIWIKTDDGLESHVDRYMNVWGSGGAHRIYFKKIDEIVEEIFNKPIDEQPAGIADMGCGDGTFLIHLYDLVTKSTERGKHLEQFPLHIVGADFNKAAREASRKNLEDRCIEHIVIDADISKPNEYASNLKKLTGLRLSDMLNVRSFIDHNRVYSPPAEDITVSATRSSGTFCYRGRLIPNDELLQNLVEHFDSWRPFVGKFGLLALELHTISPEVASKNIGNTLATAYDATHGLSDQYIVEHNVFLHAASLSKLMHVPKYQALFPSAELTTVSINLIRENE